MNYEYLKELETSTLLDVVDRSNKEVRVLAERLADSRDINNNLKLALDRYEFFPPILRSEFHKILNSDK